MKKSQIITILLIAFSMQIPAQMAISEMMIPNFKSNYTRIGFSMPTWSYFGAEGWDDYAEIFGENFARAGISGEKGTLFPVRFISFDNVKMGLNIDYIGYSTNHIWQQDDGLLDARLFFNTGFIYSNVGPFVSYYASRNIAFDLYFKFSMNWVSYAFIGTVDQYGEREWNDPYIANTDGLAALGVNGRFGGLILGIELKLGDIRYVYTPEEEVPELTYLGDWNGYSELTPVPVVNFTIGHVISKEGRNKGY